MSLSLSVNVIDVEFLKLEGLSWWSAFTSWVSDVSLILVLSVSHCFELQDRVDGFYMFSNCCLLQYQCLHHLKTP